MTKTLTKVREFVFDFDNAIIMALVINTVFVVTYALLAIR